MIREKMMQDDEAHDGPESDAMQSDDAQPAQEAAPADQEGEAQGSEPQSKNADPIALRVTQAAMKVIYSPATTKGVEKMLQSGADPMRAIAATTLYVMKVLGENAPRGIPPQSLLSAADSVVILLGEYALHMGMEVTADTTAKAQQVVQGALQQALRGGPQAGGQQAAPQQAPQQQPGIVAGAMGA